MVGSSDLVPWTEASSVEADRSSPDSEAVPGSLPQPLPHPPMTPNQPVSRTVPKVRRVRVYTRLRHALRKRLAEDCAATGRSERAPTEEAVRPRPARLNRPTPPA